MNRTIILSSICGLLFFAISANDCTAQRHVPGQNIINIDGYGWEQYGGSLSWGKCAFKGQSIFGLNFLTGPFEPCRSAVVEDGEERSYNVISHDWFASGGYLFTVAKSRNRSVNLMMGGTIDVGFREHVISSSSIGIPKLKFIYGCSPIIKFEYFPAKTFALNLHYRPRFQLYGHAIYETWFYSQFGLGCSVYIL